MTPRQIRRAEKAAAEAAAGIVPAWKLAQAAAALEKPLPVAAAHAPAPTPRQPAMTAADRRRHPEYFAVSVGVGARNGVSVNMLVAVLARCLDIPGKALGRIEIRDNYSLIEVPTAVARELPTRLHGVELCGRFLSPRPAREVLERERTHHRVR